MSRSPILHPTVLGLAVGALATGSLLSAPAALAAPSDARITEIHYDNDGTDTGEAIEVTAPSSADLAGLSVVLYNGNDGKAYGSQAVPAGPNGIAVLRYQSNGIQNGSPDGVALVDDAGTVIELLSYEGTFTATDGPAGGRTSTDIGVAETSSTPAGQSLQRTPGTDRWFGPAASTFGAPNSGANTGGGGGSGAAPTCASPTVAIGSVQGRTDTSPAVGTSVTVAGTVVGDLQSGLSGVDIQDGGDGDPATSDGIFVYGLSLPALAHGDRVVVRATVTEYKGLTELTDPTVASCGTAPLPAAAVLPLPSTAAQREALESMLVAAPPNLTVTDVYDLNRYGEVTLAQGGRLVTPTEAAEPGPAAAAVAEQNAQRSILLDDGRSTDLARAGEAPPYLTLNDPVRVGDTARLQPQVLHYGFGDWLLEPADGTADGNAFAPTNPRPPAPASVGGDLRIADFNVLNYFVDFPAQFGDRARGATNAAELAEQQAKIVSAITALNADIVTLHEIENSAVLTPDTPYRAVETLVAALDKAQGPNTWRFVRTHESSDVITNAIIYRVSAAQPVGDPVTPPEGTVWGNARKPIAQTFRSRGEVFTVIANHFKSKGSSCGTGSDDPQQGNCNGDRVAQAKALVAFADQVTRAAGDPDVLLMGDFNSYRKEDPVDVITGAGFSEVFTPGEYSYVFDGASGSLDHVFASPSMARKITGHTIWDVNAVESYAYQYDGYEPLYAPYPYRSSDHNPTLIGVDTKAGTPAAGNGRR